MRILVLGGTLFFGRHVVEAALRRGHEVTLFNRGVTGPDLFPDVEQLRGDRDGDLSALDGRIWDAAVDAPARLPRWVRSVAERLAESVDHLTLISSCSVYADTSRPGVDESAPVHVLDDETVEDISTAEVYGGLKAVCEREAERALPGRVLNVRAGLIVGPYDPTGRFTYWVHRAARGGDMIAPEPRDQPAQLVDGRDLADWVVRCAEDRVTGTMNATGPERPSTLEAVLGEIVAATGGRARPVWVDEAFLLEQGVEPWSDLPLWLAPGADPGSAYFLAIDTSRALAAGLRFRPLAETVRDTLMDAEPTGAAGLAPEREAGLLERWRSAVS